MRLFISLQLSSELKTALFAAQQTLRGNKVRGCFSPVENLHLTLAFIGEYGDPERVLDAMQNVDFREFDLELAGYIGSFGDILWAGLEKSSELESLVRKVRRALSEGEIHFDRRSFSPHITLMRRTELPKGRFAVSDVKIERASMLVTGISLMRSDHGKHGPVYTELGTVPAI